MSVLSVLSAVSLKTRALSIRVLAVGWVSAALLPSIALAVPADAPPVPGPAAPADASVPAAVPAVDPKALIGTWRVDLRQSPSSVPYFQTFVITSVEDSQILGKFYGSPLRYGRINTDWGTAAFAFVTSDLSGLYHTAGRLVNGRLEGTTHSIGRGFLSVWTAERVPQPGGK
jgi:hypothetical protein